MRSRSERITVFSIIAVSLLCMQVFIVVASDQIARNTSASSSVDDAFWLGLFDLGVVTFQETFNISHPVALIDSELGLNHTFSLLVQEGARFTVGSEIKYAGVSAGGTHWFEVVWRGSFEPVICVNGSAATYYSEFRHVYQKGSILRFQFPFGPWVEVGTFEREFIDDWHTSVYRIVTQADLNETREEYLGEWGWSARANITFSGRGVLGADLVMPVARTDVFGVSAGISLSFSGDLRAFHGFSYSQPNPYCYVDFYVGRAFDVNTFQYTSEQ